VSTIWEKLAVNKKIVSCLLGAAVLLPGLATAVPSTADSAAATTLSGAAAPSPTDVRVATLNLSSVSLDKTQGDQQPWRVRRTAVMSEIRNEKLDVLGVQEANPSKYWASHLVDGPNQYLDLRNGLNRAGGSWQVTNAAGYNCVDSLSSSNCVYQDNQASNATRILYNTDTISMVSQGSYEYQAQGPGNKQFLAYAVLRTRASGREFLFTDTHLTPTSPTVRRAQLEESIAEINRVKGDLPVIAVGDYNTQKFDPVAAEMIPAMKAAGYGDTSNQQYDTNNLRAPRPLVLTNRWLNSYNGYNRNVASFGYEDQRDRIGNTIDWVFATNSLVVKEWKVVCSMDPSTLKVRGVIPSDHNMVRVTLAMP
jgi:endonuclease/exonuclease/phosphatase family metal-dependent hydrolase